MSNPGSPTISTHREYRVYRFISDPSHKENLSGRVRAACLTCRRKKIKCSGERDCRTCREKGITCEGLPPRKQLRRASVGLPVAQSVAEKVERKRKPSSIKIESPTRRYSDALGSSAIEILGGLEQMGECKLDIADSPSSLYSRSSAIDDGNMTDETGLSQLSSADEDSLRSLSPATLDNDMRSASTDRVIIQPLDCSVTEAFDISLDELQSPGLDSPMPMVFDKQLLTHHLGSDDHMKGLSAEIPVPTVEESNMGAHCQIPQSFDVDSCQGTIPPPTAPSGMTVMRSNFAVNQAVAFDTSFPPYDQAMRRTTRVDLISGDPGCSSWWDISADMTAMLGRGLSQGRLCA